METIITTQIEKNSVEEVRLVRTDNEANKLLSEGWELMNVGVSHLDNTGYQAKPHYMLAKMRGIKNENTR